MNTRLEKMIDRIDHNLYQIEHPNFGDTDCGSERIVSAIVNITMDAFNLAVEESNIKDSDRRYHCENDLLERAVREIQGKIEYSVVDVCCSADGKLKGKTIAR